MALIRSQKAQLFEQAADLAYYLGWESSLPSTAQVQGTLFEDLSPEECQVLEWIRKHERATIDLLCAGLLLPAAAVSHILLTLELSGKVRCLPGKVYICEH